MMPRTLRMVRRGLLGLVIAVSALVAWTLRRPPAEPGSTAPTTVSPAPGSVRLGGFVIRQLKEGRESFVLQAETMAGQEQQEVRLSGVSMTFHYVSRGTEGEATVTSRECLYTAPQQKAAFRGDVRVRTRDGGELETDSLVYRGDRGFARTEAPLRFRRKDVSGSAVGALHAADEGRVELLSDVVLRVEDQKAPALEIHSDRAVLEREEGLLRFQGSVEARQGEDVLTAKELSLAFSTEDESLLGFLATGDTELRTGEGRLLPGATVTGQGRGPRILKAQRLDVTFRPDRTVKVAMAGPDAELVLMPGPGEPRERRRLAARFLTFRFDDLGRLAEVEGLRDSVLISEPLPPPGGFGRRLTCKSFTAVLEPETGQVKTVDFRRDVEITQGTRKAAADSAWYQAERNRLTLEKGPRITDSADGSRLVARVIHMATDSGDVTAQFEVQHELGRSSSRKPAFLGTDDAPAVVAAGLFEFEAASRTTRYRDGAILRAGKDEVRAPLIRLLEENGRRRFAALDGVVSVFHPREVTKGKRSPAPVEARAKQMIHEEAADTVVYTGDVVIRQGDIESKSPEATLYLKDDGKSIEKVVAGEPVEIHQGPKSASGSRATYTLGDETLVVVGDRVVLKDPVQGEIRGRSLTFRVGDDSFLVDGREEGRTEMILQKEPPRP
ncbi:MAG: LPS export ABC transporter periplasmic protein LptC [Acidobacteria bacterium]|nr:LPS export ABC transporter periplasmic protein LptC [Acidobacteriota bacterium]